MCVDGPPQTSLRQKGSEDEGKGEDDRNLMNQPNGDPNISTTAARDLGTRNR